MSIIRITNPNEMRAVHVIMLGLVILALAGNCLLTSASKPHILPDGARDWDPDSVLLALVEILDLNYSQPTPNGIAIKALVHGLGGGVGILVATCGIVGLARAREGPGESDTVIDVERLTAGVGRTAPITKKHLDPILTAQALMLLYVLWSFASAWWSHAPQFARGGSILLATQSAWAFALAYGLNRRAATYAGYILLLVLSATAAMALLYHAERNPTLRASYPIGNPLFLAACLVPGLLLAAGTVASGARDLAAHHTGRGLIKIGACLPAGAVMLYVFTLADSRGAQVGLAVGAAALVFFTGKRRVKLAITGVTLAGLICLGGYFYGQRFAASATGRSASMRVRFYAWNYALDLIRERPVLGHGQGGFALLADALVGGDAEEDPAPLGRRLSHAHNEWLEVASNLGSVGLVLACGALWLTLYGGTLAIRHVTSPAQRWTMIALHSSLTALIVTECFDVGLRIEGLPLVYYTVIGLIWALARPVGPTVVSVLARRRWLGVAAAALAAAACMVTVDLSRRDFAAARAQFDLDEALSSGSWSEAHRLARRAAHDRLSAARKLIALRQMINARLQHAKALQAQYLHRRRLADTSSEADPLLAEQARRSRRECGAQVAAGMNALEQMHSITPSKMNAGWPVYGFHGILAVFAEIDGDAEAARRHRRKAAEALRRQITREPFEPELAARYVAIATDQLALPDTIELLARPLRMRRAPRIYLELLSRFSQSADWGAVVLPLFEAAAELAGPTDVFPWSDRWAPEKLRLGAIASFTTSDYERAVRYLQAASRLYALLERDGSLAAASCFAELADALFFRNPDDAPTAIDSAEQALKRAPRSQPGRALCDAIRNRLVAYHLAAEQEDFATRLIRKQRPHIDETELNRLLAELYASMAYSVFDQVSRHTPDKLARWSARALELDPQSIPAWFLAADLAVVRRDDQKAAQCLDKIIRHGGDPENTVEILHRALRAMPDSKPLQQILDRMQQQQQQPPPAPLEELPP